MHMLIAVVFAVVKVIFSRKNEAPRTYTLNGQHWKKDTETIHSLHMMKKMIEHLERVGVGSVDKTVTIKNGDEEHRFGESNLHREFETLKQLLLYSGLPVFKVTVDSKKKWSDRFRSFQTDRSCIKYLSNEHVESNNRWYCNIGTHEYSTITVVNQIVMNHELKATLSTQISAKDNPTSEKLKPNKGENVSDFKDRLKIKLDQLKLVETIDNK
eukprot:NODE_131_length_16689_cov_0.437914.p4 type:complete len:213 gc:universal NODE_131_length_16689_cov_0.437914:16642-16004(-)